MNLEKLLKEAYDSGVIDSQIAQKMPNMKFDFNGMSNAYAQTKVENLGSFSVACQRKQLKAFAEWYNKHTLSHPIALKNIENYLESL